MIFEGGVDLRVGFMRDELTLPFPPDAADGLSVLERTYRDAHRHEFGFEGEGELNPVNLRLRAKSASGHMSFADVVAARSAAPASPPAKSLATREADFGRKDGSVGTRGLARAEIGERIA